MIKIRLKRTGRKRTNSFRIMAVDSKMPRDTEKYIKYLGYYQPQSKKCYLSVDLDTATLFISRGAVPSERVKKLLKIAGENPAYVRGTRAKD